MKGPVPQDLLSTRWRGARRLEKKWKSHWLNEEGEEREEGLTIGEGIAEYG